MTLHRALDGGWRKCSQPDVCELLFHVEDLDGAQLAGIPLQLLLPWLNIVQPPQLSTPELQIWHSVDRTASRILWHRDYDLPAVVHPDGYMEWWRAGQLHRECGPAIISPDGTGAWYHHGRQVTGGTR